MPPRLNKRQLREQEELLALELAKHSDASASDDAAESDHPPNAAPLGFAALMTTAREDSDSEPEQNAPSSKPKKQKKKKKKILPSEQSPRPVSPTHATSLSGPTKKERKALKKQKAKEKKDGDDDFDRAIAELSLKYPDLKSAVSYAPSTPASRGISSLVASLLSVSVQHLDSEAEMRKFFGAKVVSASKDSVPGPSTSRRQPSIQRSNLTRPKPTWWPAQLREGLSIRLLSADEVEKKTLRHAWGHIPGESIWTVEYSKKYRGVTLAFMQTVMSGDPQGFYSLLKILPWHADTLLQLSEVYYHREEHSTASDHIDRALFAYERAFVGAFNFTSGTNRLDFDRVENRPFFLALHRQVSDLQRRGCIRTAFEFARLLYALDPWSDPHGVLLHLDYVAIKSGMHKWLLEVWDLFAKQASSGEDLYRGRVQVTMLPGWAYARALALRIDEDTKGDKNNTNSTNALKDAILACPSIVPLLADKADIPLSAAARAHSVFRIHTDASTVSTEAEAIFHLLSHLYAQRSFSLWKPPTRASWFASTVDTLLTSLPPFATPTPAFTALCASASFSSSVYRHVIVLESSCRRLFGFLPRAVTGAKHLSCDPLPPPTRVNEYDDEFFKGVENVLTNQPISRRARERRLDQLIPDPAFRGQLQAFFGAHPNFAARFPGGIVQFVEFAAGLPEEVLEDLMIAHVDDPGAPQGMPGQMPGEEAIFADFSDGEEEEPQARGEQHDQDHADEEELEQEDEDAEELEEIAPLPVRIFRGFMNRLWGGAAPNAEDSSDEAPAPRDDDGVD